MPDGHPIACTSMSAEPARAARKVYCWRFFLHTQAVRRLVCVCRFACVWPPPPLPVPNPPHTQQGAGRWYPSRKPRSKPSSMHALPWPAPAPDQLISSRRRTL